VQFGESGVGQAFKLCDVFAVALGEQRQHVVPWSSHAPTGSCGCSVTITRNSGKGGALAKRSFGLTSTSAG